jgi:GTP-binding protein Era
MSEDINHTPENFRCGMVTIVGRPNVGKSTLLNQILQEKVAIVSPVPQTTRNQIRGIYNDERGQIIFIDTPGLHLEKDKLDQFMNRTAAGTTHDADCVIYLVDTRDPIGREEEAVAGRLAGLSVPVVLGLNKVDLKGPHICDYISLWERVKGKPANEIQGLTILPLSGKERLNIDKLIDILFEHLPQGPALYPRDIVCDIPQRMVIADIVREKLLGQIYHEIPHAIAVLVEDMEPRRKQVLHIRVLILVERDSQKVIVIGKNGDILKRVGTEARKELEELLESKVFLDIYVKSRRKWRDDDALLEEMGYKSI